MDASGGDALGAFRWGLRHYAWLFVTCVLAVAVLIPALALLRPATSDAQALIVAQRLDMNLAALPRYAEALFDDGEIARRVAARVDDSGPISDVVPNRVSLTAEQDSIVLQVVGHDRDPEVAAAVANLAAQAFVEALNAPGEGVGAFAIQSPALAPAQPATTISGPAAALPVGLAAGLLLGLAAVSVMLVVRRPVLEAGDAERATGVPVLGTVTLAKGEVGIPPTTPVDGIIPVGRRLLALGLPTIHVVAPARAQTVRRQVAVTLAAALQHAAEVRFVAAPDLCAAAGLRPPAGGVESATVAIRANGTDAVTSGAVTLVDVADPLDTGPPSPTTVTVLLVETGMPLASLQSAVAEHLGGSPARLLLVRHGKRARTGQKDRSPVRSTADDGDRKVSRRRQESRQH